MRSLILLSLATTLSATAAMAGEPDIVLDDIRATVVGDDVMVTIQFYNDGDADSGAFWVDLYTSKAGAWQLINQKRHYQAYVGDGLEIDQVSVRSFTLQHDEWDNFGRVFGTVDVDALVDESDETNNLGELYIMDAVAGAAVHPCANANRAFPGILPGHWYLTAAFLADQQPHLYCWSRVL
ncbi:MAG: CARDB domain-containing protein [Myxococcota bacterium]